MSELPEQRQAERVRSELAERRRQALGVQVPPEVYKAEEMAYGALAVVFRETGATIDTRIVMDKTSGAKPTVQGTATVWLEDSGKHQATGMLPRSDYTWPRALEWARGVLRQAQELTVKRETREALEGGSDDR